MPKSSKAGAILVMIIGVLVAAFFIATIAKGGFSVSSLIGVLVGAGATLWQFRSIKSNSIEDDDYDTSEEW